LLKRYAGRKQELLLSENGLQCWSKSDKTVAGWGGRAVPGGVENDEGSIRPRCSPKRRLEKLLREAQQELIREERAQQSAARTKREE